MLNRVRIRDRLKKMGPEFLITSVAQALYLLQNVVQTKIFTYFFSTAVFGQWSLIVSAYTLISMIPFSALDQGIYRVAYSCSEEKKERQLYTLLVIVYVSFFILYSGVFVLLNKIQGEVFFASGYTLAFSLYAFTEILKNSYVILDNAYRNRKRVLYIRIFGISSRTVLFLLFNALGRFTLGNVLWILFATNLLILAYQSTYLREIEIHLDLFYCKSLGKRILAFSGPLLTWAIFGWMQNMISRWYLDSILDLESVAMYSVLTTLSFFVPNAVYTIVNSYVMPIVFQKNIPYTRHSLIRYIATVFAPMFVYLLAICFLGRYLITLLTSAEYLAILQYLPYTTFTAILYVIAMLSTVEIYRRGNTKKLLLSTILPGLFMATAGYFLIKHWGFVGAVWNYMAGHIIYMVLTFFVVFNKKNIGVS